MYVKHRNGEVINYLILMYVYLQDIPGVVCLVNMYPNYVKVKDLPLKEDENKV